MEVLKLMIAHSSDRERGQSTSGGVNSTIRVKMSTECPSQSIGPVNQLFSILVNTLLASQCAISPESLWPSDYGPTAIEQGL